MFDGFLLCCSYVNWCREVLISLVMLMAETKKDKTTEKYNAIEAQFLYTDFLYGRSQAKTSFKIVGINALLEIEYF